MTTRLNAKIHVSTLRVINGEHFYREAVVVYEKPIATEYDIDALRRLAAYCFGDSSHVGIRILFWTRME